MTTTRTSTAARSLLPGRRTFAALIAGAGIALAPLPAQAHTVAPAPAAAPAASAPAPTSAAQKAVDTAMAQRGKPYKWGAAGPNAFDCSGLTQFAYKAAGIELPHSSKMQATKGRAVSKADLKPGDLVFSYSPISHVSMYIGNGQMVYAPTAGQVVKVGSVNSMPFTSARRVA